MLDYCIAAHRSQEPGHAIALEALGLEPLLDLDLRLGEASGAALALPIVEAAARMVREMQTFAEAGVATESEPRGDRPLNALRAAFAYFSILPAGRRGGARRRRAGLAAVGRRRRRRGSRDAGLAGQPRRCRIRWRRHRVRGHASC